MDKDRVKGKAKDIAGRIQRQAGEWTGSEEQQAKGTAKQVEGKVQNVVGQAKDAGRDAMRNLQEKEKDLRREHPEEQPMAEEDPRKDRAA